MTSQSAFLKSVLATLALVCTGCVSFATVRSAQVSPGASFRGQASVASPPGKDAAWFFNLCETGCNPPLLGADLGLEFGAVPETRSPYAVGAGLNGFFPYVEGYLQVGRSKTHPKGIGARVGIPMLPHWRQHQVYARVNRPIANGIFLWNPGVLLHHGTSPNGENPGSLTAIVNGFGWQGDEGDVVVVTSSVAVVFARAQRTSYGAHISQMSTFATAGLSITFR